MAETAPLPQAGGDSYVADTLLALDIDAYLLQHQHKSLLRFITCGSVDDGKSTLIGRLLYDSKTIFEDQRTALEADSKRVGTHGQDIVTAHVQAPKYKINVNTMEHVAAKTLELNAIGVANLSIDKPIVFDPYDASCRKRRPPIGRGSTPAAYGSSIRSTARANSARVAATGRCMSRSPSMAPRRSARSRCPRWG